MAEINVSIDSDGRPTSMYNGCLNYETMVFEGRMNFAREVISDLTVADCPLLPRTFWIDGLGTPRCLLEALALEILRTHVPHEALGRAGAEYWVQRRPGGRADILLQRQKMKRQRTTSSMGPASHRMDWHFDKDEELQAGTGLFLAPQLSTVTYLTSHGGPTVVLDCAAHPASGEPVQLRAFPQPADRVAADIVFPEIGRHLKFDGRKLHGVVPPLTPRQASDDCPRLTFLVNIWIDHKPIAIEPFPLVMLDKLSPVPLAHQLSFLPTDQGLLPTPFPDGGGPRRRLEAPDDDDERRGRRVVFAPPEAFLAVNPYQDDRGSVVRLDEANGAFFEN